jgi:CHAD domain-containing protein
MKRSSNHEASVERTREVFREQLQAATANLGADQADVHGARKQLKRARATLRLLRASIGDNTYRRENEAVRDVAQPLSPVRDSEILIEAFDGLMERAKDAASSLPVERLRRGLKRHRAQVATHSAGKSQLTRARESLRSISQRSQHWPQGDQRWRALKVGLRRAYRSGRKALEIARAEPTTEHLHEWRKQAKYSWYQLQQLEPLAPKAIGRLADRFHRLTTQLGDDHDLAVLLEQLSAAGSPLNGGQAVTLRDLIERRRAQLQEKAFACGKRLYADTPKAFAARLNRYRKRAR